MEKSKFVMVQKKWIVFFMLTTTNSGRIANYSRSTAPSRLPKGGIQLQEDINVNENK